MSDKPIPVLGNKIHVPNAASEHELLVGTRLFNKTTGKDSHVGNDNRCQIEVFMMPLFRRIRVGVQPIP